MLAAAKWVAPLDYFKAMLNLRTADYDHALKLIINNVTQYLEGWLGYNLISQSYVHDNSTLKRLMGTGTPYLWLQHRPLTTLTSVSIEDEDSIDTTDDDIFNYVAETSKLILIDGRLWTRKRKPNINCSYTAGYTTYSTGVSTPTMPGTILQVAVELVGRKWQEWERKGPQITEVNVGTDSRVIFTLSDMSAEQKRMLAPYRSWGRGIG